MTPARKFTEAEDEMIKAEWTGPKTSDEIGAMCEPKRPGSAIRIRARRLGLPGRESHVHKARPGNAGRGRSKSKRQGPSLVFIRALDNPGPAIPPEEIPVRARDFIRWRQRQAERHSLGWA